MRTRKDRVRHPLLKIFQVSQFILLFQVLLLLLQSPLHANPVAAMSWYLYVWNKETIVNYFITITIIEAVIILIICRIGFLKSLGISMLMNIISALAGYSIYGAFSHLLSIFILTTAFDLLVIILSLVRKVSLLYFIFSLIFIFTGFYFLIPFINAISEGIPMDGHHEWLITLPLFLPFGLALLVEYVIASYFIDRNKAWKSILTANLVTYILTAVFIFHGPNTVFISEYMLRDPSIWPGLGVSDEYYWSQMKMLNNEIDLLWVNNHIGDSLGPDAKKMEILDSGLLDNPDSDEIFKLATLIAISNNDQDTLGTVQEKWYDWYLRENQIDSIPPDFYGDIYIRESIEKQMYSKLELPGKLYTLDHEIFDQAVSIISNDSEFEFQDLGVDVNHSLYYIPGCLGVQPFRDWNNDEYLAFSEKLIGLNHDLYANHPLNIQANGWLRDTVGVRIVPPFSLELNSKNLEYELSWNLDEPVYEIVSDTLLSIDTYLENRDTDNQIQARIVNQALIPRNQDKLQELYEEWHEFYYEECCEAFKLDNPRDPYLLIVDFLIQYDVDLLPPERITN